MSGTSELMVGLLMALGSEEVYEIVGGLMILCCKCSIKRESCLSLIWLAVCSPTSLAWMESMAVLLMTLLGTPASLKRLGGCGS